MSYSVYPINTPTCNLPVIVSGIGYEDNQPHVFRKEGFPTPQIFICKSGDGTLKESDNVYIIKEGTFFFLMPNTPHEYYGNTDKWELIWISFSGTQLENILNVLRFDRTKIGILSNMNKIEALIHKLFVTLKADDNSGIIISSSILYEILVELYTMLQKTYEDETSDGNIMINRIKHYIDEHYNEDITIEGLSDLVNITPQYLCRMFKKYLNLRPFQYIAMKRIQRAKIMLSDHTLSIHDIARSVGYNDCSYFCAIFKKHEMISPSEYRGLKFN